MRFPAPPRRHRGGGRTHIDDMHRAELARGAPGTALGACPALLISLMNHFTALSGTASELVQGWVCFGVTLNKTNDVSLTSSAHDSIIRN